jgi:hypothetical protein
MRADIHVLVLFGFTALVQGEDASVTNANRPRTIQAARDYGRIIPQHWFRPEANSGTNAARLVLATNALTLASSPDIKQNLFRAYCKALQSAVEGRWIGLLEQRGLAYQKSGEVALDFQLHQDGRVTDMKVKQSTVGEALSLICQKSVLDPCPFAAWPSEMRKGIGAEHCTLTLNFKYPPDGGRNAH